MKPDDIAALGWLAIALIEAGERIAKRVRARRARRRARRAARKDKSGGC